VRRQTSICVPNHICHRQCVAYTRSPNNNLLQFIVRASFYIKRSQYTYLPTFNRRKRIIADVNFCRSINLRDAIKSHRLCNCVVAVLVCFHYLFFFFHFVRSYLFQRDASRELLSPPTEQHTIIIQLYPLIMLL